MRIKTLTGIIPPNSRFHDSLHPLSNDSLFVRAEEVRFVSLMYYLESIASGVGVLVRNNLVTQDVDITLDFCFLDELESIDPDPHM
jgi:hypothetical protein